MTAERDLAGTVNGIPERFVPDEMRGQLVEAEHMARYMWAAQFAEGRRVLDAGCGLGYGAAMLRDAGASAVTAVDISQPIVDVARESVGSGVAFEVAPVERLPFADSSFDLVVCFEVLEHLDEGDAAVDEFRRVLGPEGLLVISSPNRASYVPGNPHHKHEYLPGELRRLLENRFAGVRLFTQQVMVSSVLRDAAQPDVSDAQVATMVPGAAEDQTYIVAMAGSDLPAPGRPIVSLTQFLEVRTWLEHMDRQDQMLREQGAALAAMEDLRATRREALALLAEREAALEELPALRERLRVAEAELEELRGHADQAVARAERAERVVRDVKESASWRITAPLRGAKQALGERRGHR